jgi:ABC-type transporter Mla subunit MlaD
MNKKDLEKKLKVVDQRLSELGDLTTLVNQSKDIPALINETQVKKEELESFSKNLPLRLEEFSGLEEKAKTLTSKLTKQDQSVSAAVNQVNELRLEVKNLVDETRVQLGKGDYDPVFW